MRNVIPKRAIMIPKNAKRVFSGKLYDVYQWDQQLFDGTTTIFEMLKRPDAIRIIAIKDGKIVSIEQEQPHRGFFFDIPGGAHDRDDESELDAAKRELLEETGLVFNSWKLLSVVQPNNSIERFHYTFLATEFDHQENQQLDAGEKVIVKFLNLDDTKDKLSSAQSRFYPTEIKNASSIDDLLNLPEYS